MSSHHAPTLPSPFSQSPEGSAGRLRYDAVAALVLGVAVSVLDTTVMNLALPDVAAGMRVSAAQVVWVVNAYLIAVLALLLPLATLGDRIGYRRVYLAGLCIFTLASLACALATTLAQLSMARVLQGVGSAAMFAVNAGLVRTIYPQRLLGRGFAINSAVVATCSVAGPSIAALVLSIAAWPWLFAMNVPLGLLVLALGWRAIPGPASVPSGPRLQIVDVVLNAASFGLLLLGVNWLIPRAGQVVTASSPAAAALCLGIGLAVGAAYVRRQRRQAVPLLPLDLLRLPVFRLSIGTSVASFAAYTLALVSLPFFLLEDLRRSHADAGLALSAWPVATLLAAPVAGRLIGRVPSGLLAGLGLATQSLGLVSMVLLPQQPSLLGIAACLALCGAGFGFFQSPNNYTIVTSAPAARAGAAGGMLATARLMGQTIGATAVAALFGLSGLFPVKAPVMALVVAATCAAAGSTISLLRLRVTPKD